MSPSPHSLPPSRERDDATPFWRLSRRTWLMTAAAFAIGLLLFVLLWSSKRDNDFFRVAPAPGLGTGSEYEPLPAPLLADGTRNSSVASTERDETTEAPRIVEPARAPQVAAPEPPPPPRAAAAAPATGATPVPIEMPTPRYPSSAARRGLGGKVRVRVDVGVDGVPTEVVIAEGSGIRDLDRAALEAVRRWRFRPGQVDGRPVAGSVVVPIEFAARD